MSKNNRFTTKTLAYCALMVALNVAAGRLLSFMPDANTRISLGIGSMLTFLSGVFFGPVAGGMVGFASDFINAMFTGFGYNPIFCLPPILYGVVGGLFRPLLAKKMRLGWVALGYAIPVVFGSILYQSWAIGMMSGKGFLFFLAKRAVQFPLTWALDVVLIMILSKTNVFKHMGVWPLINTKAEPKKEPCNI